MVAGVGRCSFRIPPVTRASEIRYPHVNDRTMIPGKAPDSRLRAATADAREWHIMTASQRLFPPTSQTLIHKIQHGEASAREVSLARFCSMYYPAIYGYARMRGLDVEDAKDRTQDFFVLVVKEGLLTKFNAQHGARLSSWLMVCFKNLDLKHRARRNADKRGGGREFVSFDTDFAEQCHQSMSAAHLSADSALDLTLARTIWRNAQDRLLQRHMGGPNESIVREVLPFVLLGQWPDAPAPSQADIAVKHGRTSVQLKAFFNRTLKPQACRYFAEEATESNAGIGEQEVGELWTLLRTHAGE